MMDLAKGKVLLELELQRSSHRERKDRIQG
jgi:hypothetical protein